MKRLIIVCEGQTEQSFCQNVLSPYFLTKGFVVEAPTIKHSHGGIVPWGTLKRQLVEHLHEGGCHCDDADRFLSYQGFLSVPWVGRSKNDRGFPNGKYVIFKRFCISRFNK